jgi:hypothetical protein
MRTAVRRNPSSFSHRRRWARPGRWGGDGDERCPSSENGFTRPAHYRSCKRFKHPRGEYFSR